MTCRDKNVDATNFVLLGRTESSEAIFCWFDRKTLINKSVAFTIVRLTPSPGLLYASNGEYLTHHTVT